VRAKDEVRQEIWRGMDREGVSRFPGAEGRIPNFAGAKQAAERLAKHPDWIRAETIKANPDSPQTHARRLALAQGKFVVMAVPRLREEHPFRLLDPRKLNDLEQVPQLDFILTGSVAVNLKGARLGKGGGFSDLEYGLLSEAGKVDRRTVIATTVHPLQIVRENLLVTDHDTPVDLIATPRAVIEVERAYERPRGIRWDHLQPPQIHEIPVLERMGYAG
jgi:5-formyltetrahydrofolate cyclo-ligase